MARKLTYARVRLETVESRIGLYMAKGEADKANAIVHLLRDCGYTIDQKACLVQRNRWISEIKAYTETVKELNNAN